jgi:hypothetical protein
LRIKATPREAEVLLRRRVEAVDRAVRDSEKATLADALKIAQKLSSGPFTTAMLRALGHPYSRRRPNPPADPAIINVQTGAFRAGWKATGPFNSRGGLVSRLRNLSPYAGFLFSGTSRMIARPIAQAIQGRVRDLRYRRMREAVNRALIEGR